MHSATINKLLQPTIETLGFELLGTELEQQRGKLVLRVYVDSPKGVTVEDCARISRQISAVLDVENPISDQYDLEVSSPGLDRPLFTIAHYQRFLGHKVKFKLRKAQQNQRNFVGVLKSVEDDKIIFDLGENELRSFDLNEIERANIVPEL